MTNEVQWMLVSQTGVEHPLPQTMIFLGREECDVTLHSRSVDKRHAVITYDHYEKRFKVKDLNSTNGTYVNDNRIPEQTYMKLEHTDTVRFGYDPTVYHIQCLKQQSLDFSPSKTEIHQDNFINEDQSTMPEAQNNTTTEEIFNGTDPAATLNTLAANAIKSATTLLSSPPSPAPTDLCNNTIAGIPTNRLLGCTQEGDLNGLESAHSQNHTSASHHPYRNSHSCSAVNLPPANSGHQSNSFLSTSSVANGPVIPDQALREGLCIAPGYKQLQQQLQQESTSSNTSLQSAFSGDSLDQLVDGSGEKIERSKSLPANRLDLSLLPTNNSGKSAKNRCNKTTNVNNSCTESSTSKEEIVSPSSASDKVIQRVPPTAFTIEFDDMKESARKLDIKDSISKFAPFKADGERLGHRRNSSLSKVDEHKFGKAKSEHQSPESEKDYLIASQRKMGNLRRGYHSEGYFSSDQDDDHSAKSDLMGFKRTKHIDRESYENTGYGHHYTNEKNRAKNKDATNRSVNSSAAFLINKMLNSAVKDQVSNLKIASSQSSLKATDFVPVINSRDAVKQTSSNTSLVEDTILPRPSVLKVKSSISETVSIEAKNEEIKENVSESGTYTIDKESPNLELEEARRNIDRVFGITVEENEDSEEAVISGPRPPFAPAARESSQSPESESSRSKFESSALKKKSLPWSPGSGYRAKQSGSDIETSSSQTTITVSKTLSNSTTNEMILNFSDAKQRPRRKLPTPPVDKLPFALALSRLGDVNLENSEKTKAHDTTPTDAAYDTERHLRDTETVMSAMEARMDHKSLMLAMGSSFESRDSGGESDVDTSTASYCNDKSHKQDKNIGKRLSSQLKAKLKQLNNNSNVTAVVQRQAACKQTVVMHTVASNEREVTLSDNETASVASDVSSSSDISGSPRPHRKRGDKLPPTMKFNRAFSLRRARLGYCSDGANEKPIKPVTNTSTRLSTPKPKKEESSAKKNGSRSSSGGSSNITAGGSLSRSDGGRFSLRVAKSIRGTSGSSVAKAEDSLKSKHRPGPTTSQTPTAIRSNSTLSKETEMKNWKRRKEYDPMKAAAEGRKKEAAKKAAQYVDQSRPSAMTTNSIALQRSASFHGTEGLRVRRTTYTSEDDMARSLEDDAVINVNVEDEDEYMLGNHVYSHSSDKIQTVSADEYQMESGYRLQGQSEMSYSARTLTGSTAYRHKNKLEALDNLVITRIHHLSTKLCGYTEGVLKKVNDQCKSTSDARSPFLEDLISSFSSPDTPLSPNARNTSRELAGTLKNLNKLEKGLQVLDRLVCDTPSDSQKCNGLPEEEFY